MGSTTGGGGGSVNLGGGYNNNNSKNKFTYLGDDAGNAAGPLGNMIRDEYNQSLRAGDEADYIFGGANYGNHRWGQPTINGQPTTGGGGNAGGPPGGLGQSNDPSPSGKHLGSMAMQEPDQGFPHPREDNPGWDNGVYTPPGDSGGTGWVPPDETGDWNDYGDGNDQPGGEQGGPGGGGPNHTGGGGGPNGGPVPNPNTQGTGYGDANAAPTGGLMGAFQDVYSNPATQQDRDVEGTYDWFASGLRNGAEDAAQKRYWDVANDPASRLEQETSGGYSKFAAGPNARDQALYGEMGRYGGSQGQYDPLMGETYSKMVTSGGYTPEQQNDMMVAAQQAARAQEGAAADQMRRTTAATNNQSGLYGAQARLGVGTAKALADSARETRMAAANEAIRQREAGAAGLQGVQQNLDTRQRYGLSGQAELANQANQNALSALGGNAAMGANLGNRQMSAMNQISGQNALMRQYQMAGTQGKQQQQNELFNRKMQGLGGLGQLYQSAVQRQQQARQQAGDLMTKPREVYGEGGAANGGLSL